MTSNQPVTSLDQAFDDKGQLVVARTIGAAEAEALRGRTRQMIEIAAPLAVQTLVRCLKDPLPVASVTRAKVDAAKALLAIAGYVAPKAGDAPGDRKPAEEMSADELRQFIEQAQRTLAERARPVLDVTQAPPQATDMLD